MPIMFRSLSWLIVVLAACMVGCVDRDAPPVVTPTPTTDAAPAPVVESPTTVNFTQGYVAELADGQVAADFRAAAEKIFKQVVSVDALFPETPADDDPYRLRYMYQLRVADPLGDELPWDLAYRLRETGNFIRVEPDTNDTILDAQKRSASVACLNAPVLNCSQQPRPRACDPSWSLREMNVDGARSLVPTPGGKALGEGVRICHPDSGWTNHVDLDKARIDTQASLNLIAGGSDARDPLGYRGNPGHGTATGSVLISDGGIGATDGTTSPGSVVGLAPKATLVPIRALNSVVQVLDSDIARAVQHATKAKCDVISMSLGGRLFFGLQAAINDAVRRDVIVVNAAGNCVGFVVAPASYDNAIAVAATNADHKPWKGSSKGRAVDISAPGEDVHVARAVSGTIGTLAEPGDGTSFATAAVAGAAADWIAFHGRPAIKAAQGNLTRRDLFVRTMQTTANAPPGWDRQQFGPGILDLKRLLQKPLGPARTELTTPPKDDTVALLSRMFDRDPASVRDGLHRILGAPADFDAELNRYGPELLELAARDPDAFLRALDPPVPGELTAPALPLQARASRRLGALIDADR
jgi:hypothetical protein